jgi:hypothetical protein
MAQALSIALIATRRRAPSRLSMSVCQLRKQVVNLIVFEMRKISSGCVGKISFFQIFPREEALSVLEGVKRFYKFWRHSAHR